MLMTCFGFLCNKSLESYPLREIHKAVEIHHNSHVIQYGLNHSFSGVSPFSQALLKHRFPCVSWFPEEPALLGFILPIPSSNSAQSHL